MTTRTIRFTLCLAALVLAAAASARAEMATPSSSRATVDDVVHAYLEVHESLAGDSLRAARAGAGSLAQAVARLGDAAPAADSLTSLSEAAQALSQASDIEAARRAFAELSGQMLALVSGPAGEGVHTTLYGARCPMALGKGADWLQSDKEVANPYYGAKMLSCGSLQGHVAGPPPAEPEGHGAHDEGMHGGGDHVGHDH